MKTVKKTTRRSLEWKEQCELVAYLRLHGILVAAIPNGGGRDARTAANLKRMGLLAGMPDLLVLGQKGETMRPLVFVEMKAPGGSLSDSQKKVFPQLRAMGYRVITVESWLNACNQLAELGYKISLP